MPPSKAAIRAPVFAAGSPVTSAASGARSPTAQQSSPTHSGTRGASAPPTAISFGRCPAHTTPRRSPPTLPTSPNPSPEKPTRRWRLTSPPDRLAVVLARPVGLVRRLVTAPKSPVKADVNALSTRGPLRVAQVHVDHEGVVVPAGLIERLADFRVAHLPGPTRRAGGGQGRSWHRVPPWWIDLSAVLRGLAIFPPNIRENPRFRNPAGVALKVSNFAAIDRTYLHQTS